MAKKLYIGNLPFTVTDEELNQVFSEHGAVASAVVIKNKFNNRSKGFGFVEYNSDEDANKAIEAMNGKEYQGRPLVVNEARPMQPRAQQPYPAA